MVASYGNSDGRQGSFWKLVLQQLERRVPYCPSLKAELYQRIRESLLSTSVKTCIRSSDANEPMEVFSHTKGKPRRRGWGFRCGYPIDSRFCARFFTPAQHALVEQLSETIIPADSHSGGAKAAKVADYIDQFLRESYDDNEKALWREGLRLVDVMSQHYNGKSFVSASPEGKIAVVKVLSDNDHMTDLPEVRFFIELKRLTVRGYYTSKIGIHDELEYKGNRILQEYVGCDDQGPATS